MTDRRTFAERVYDLTHYDSISSPSALLGDSCWAALHIWDTLALADGIGIAGYQQAAAEVKLLRSAEQPILYQDTRVVVSLRLVVTFLARIFAIDPTKIDLSDVYSTACREHLREVVLAILNREGELRLFAECIRVLIQRAANAQSGHSGFSFVEVDEGSDEAAHLTLFLAGLNLRPIQVDMPEVGHLLTF